MERRVWILWLTCVCLTNTVDLKNSEECPKSCQSALGLENGLIKDEQLSAFSAYYNDSSTFGVHRARLNLNSWPPGYRAQNLTQSEIDKPWIMIDLGREVIVTGIATQGYGDASVAEWVTSYRLMYAAGEQESAYHSFIDDNGEVQVFDGNRDSNTIRKHEVIVPAIARSLLLLPSSWHNNVGIRMEVYGCKPGYYFEAWLGLNDRPFLLQYVNTSSDQYKGVALKAKEEINSYFNTVGGYLYNRLLRLSPWSSTGATLTTAEIAVYCTETSVHLLTSKLKEFIRESALFDSEYLDIIYPFACDCKPPVVNLQLKHSVSESDILYTTNRSIHLIPEVTTNCSTSNQTQYQWMFCSTEIDTNYFGTFIMTASKTIELKPRMFGPGILYVSLLVVIPEVPGTTSYDYGFLRIRQPDLVAKIIAPKTISKNNTNIKLNSSGSYDPEFKWLSYRGLKFTWRCQRKCRWEPLGTLSVSKDEVEPCYGIANLTDSVFSSERIVTIDVTSLKSDCTYLFNLEVAKDSRIAHTEHALEVTSSITFYIRCINNCLKKVSPQRLLTLEVVCGSLSCASVATFSWTIYIREFDNQGKSIWSEFNNASGLVTTSLNTTQFNLPRLDALIEVRDGQKFQIKVKSIYHRGQRQEQKVYIFPVNAPPKLVQSADTGCKVTPREGSAILTDFYITCLGWYDKDQPLRYAFKYTFSSSTIIIQDGSVGNVTSKLPLGDPDKDHERILELQIIDAFGEFSTVYVKTKVRPPPASEALLKLIREAENEMELLVKNKDVDKAADMAITILSVVDNNDQLKQDETFKDSVLEIMAGVEVNRLNLVTKVAVITAYSTKRVNHSLPQSTQENALTLLTKSTKFLATMKNDTTKELEVGDEINVNIVTGIGNVMRSASKDARYKTADDVDPTVNREKSKNITKSCMKLVNMMKDEVIEAEGICENPVVITTPFLNLTACVEKANDMKVQKLLKGENGVKLPDPSALFPGQVLDDNTVVDVKLVSFRENPYTWHVNSRIIKSSVLDVTLKNVTSGKAIHVEGLTKPVELFVKNWEREEEENKRKEKKKTQEETFVKPSPPNSIRNMRFHKISLSLYKDIETDIKIVPSNNEKLEIYIRYGVRPTPAENNFQTIVPNFSNCSNYNKQNGYFNCLSDPYLFTISPKITGHSGTHYLGIRYVPEPLLNDNKNSTRKNRSCRDASGRRQKRSCVEVKRPPSVAKLATSEFQNGTDVKYTMTVGMGTCMYWSEETEEWTNKGCKMGSKSTISKIHCLCNHLSAFGGDFFVAPNPIDFDKVFAEFSRLGETGNFVVLSFVCLVFGIYAVGLVFARKADKKDDFVVAPNIHLMMGGEGDCAHTYDISIQTGIWKGSGTSANVTIVLFGENGCSPPILLSQNHLEKKFFARGSVNTFTLHLSESLGSLFKIQIWHDNTGKNPSWFFHQVLVACNATDEKWYFLGNRWLALEKGNGEIEAEIASAGKKESLAFKNLFYFRGAKTLSEKHLWLSLFTKAPHSTFTRCQRLSCCMSILFAAMVTNAMFYKQGVAMGDAFKLGPFLLSWTQIKIGLQSGLVAIPVNALVVAIFRNIRPSASKQSDDKNTSEDTKPIGCFPHCCVYIGWTLCLMASFVSGAFIVFYSLMWGKEVANQWLASVTISFFQDVVVIQPIKVVVLVSLLSLIIKKPIENDEIYGRGHSSQKMDRKLISYPPRDEELHRVRSVSVLNSKLVKALMEIAIFVLFLSLLMMVCYGNRDSTRYQLTESVKGVFKGFKKVNSIETFWRWTEKNLISGLYDVKWYNGRPFIYKEGYIHNREAFIVGMPRLRQKRVKKDAACQISHIEPRFIQRFPRCISCYSEKTEDKAKYYMPKWIPVLNESEFQLHFERFFLCPRPWRYETAEELQTLSFQGLTSTYSGGGYVADLGYNTEDAQQVIDSLKSKDWINNMTAAVFIEFTVYEPATSLFSAIKLLFERFPNGGTNTITQFKTLTIYSPQDPNFRRLYEICQLLFICIILFCVGLEVMKIYTRGCEYFKDLWSWLEIVLLASSVFSLAVFFLKESYTSKFVKKVKKNPFQSWSTDSIALWSDLEVTLLSFVVFLVTMKLLRIIRFNPHIIQMRMTLSIAAEYFWSFTVVFMTIILAYVTLTTLTFGRNVDEYRSFLRSFSSILLMLIGAKAPFYKLQTISIFIGPFFVFAYMVTIVMIFLNMFLAILNEAYTESREIGQEGLADAAISNLLKRKAKKAAKQTKVVAVKVLQAIPNLVRQKRPQTAVEFENERWNELYTAEEMDGDSGFNDNNNTSLRDIIALLYDIKYDMSNSVLSLDDIVPMVTIHDADKRWSRPNYCSDDEDEYFYSCSSSLLSLSDNTINLQPEIQIYRRYNRKSMRHDIYIMDEWNHCKNLSFGETFV